MKEKISCKMSNRQYYLWTDRCEWTDELTDEYYEYYRTLPVASVPQNKKRPKKLWKDLKSCSLRLNQAIKSKIFLEKDGNIRFKAL